VNKKWKMVKKKVEEEEEESWNALSERGASL
jgi:hypothetical protein